MLVPYTTFCRSHGGDRSVGRGRQPDHYRLAGAEAGLAAHAEGLLADQQAGLAGDGGSTPRRLAELGHQATAAQPRRDHVAVVDQADPDRSDEHTSELT